LSASERASIALKLILSLDDPSSLDIDQDQEFEIRRLVQKVKKVRHQLNLLNKFLQKLRPTLSDSRNYS